MEVTSRFDESLYGMLVRGISSETGHPETSLFQGSYWGKLPQEPKRSCLIVLPCEDVCDLFEVYLPFVLTLCKNTILFPSWSLAGILRSSFTSQELVSGDVGHQQVGDAGASAPTQSLAIGTPGISTSPLLAEFTGPDGAHALGAVVGDIVSFISMNDRITGSTPGNGSRAAAGEDLVAS
ncbi:hypothetical protein KIW84_035210 [Lathyrus oleraceus]|uniref:Uncharacterized protein n=1 Tax=Pisum sativum TaxID=3888 RepID=A0A9D4Y4Y6_PEA|nr:hypothetical protein KIW84_035210 [Pisum sativum]